MGAEERAKNETWAMVRVVLGLLQMTGAATIGLLLVTSGVTPVAIAVAAITGALLVLSLLLFRRG